MKTNTKIRWLLLIVTIGLFATSLTARWAATRSSNLEDVAQDIADKLGEKELFIYDYLADSVRFQNLKRINKNASEALDIINYFTSNQVYFQVFKDDQLVFWSDNKISASYALNIKQGASFVEYQNGWYEVVKKDDKNYSIIFYILVKDKYPYRNQFLNDHSSNSIIKDPTIGIADINDKNVADIRNLEDRYLFSIKRTAGINNIPYTNIEILMWAIGLLTLCLLINSICKYYADNGSPILASLALLFAFIALRFVGLQYHFPDALYNLDIFSPRIYASNYYFPSLADYGLNILLALWFTIFVFSYKEKIFKPIHNLWFGYPILIYAAFFIALLSNILSDLFFGLVFNSNINFKVTNIVNLDGWSVIGIGLLLLTLLTYYLIVVILIDFSAYIKIKLEIKAAIMVVVLIGFNLYQSFFDENTVFLLLIFLLILIIARVVYQYKGQIVFPALVLITLILATLVSIKLNRYENIKELETRKRLAIKLESADDPHALILFTEIEEEIFKDDILSSYFKNPQGYRKRLYSKFQNYYLTGYLGEYDFKLFAFRLDGSALEENEEELNTYKTLVESGAIKVSDNFYRVSNTFGLQNYFAIIPVKEKDTLIGSMVIELRSKDIREFGTFPQLFKDGKLISIEDYVDYSYAYYYNNKLIYQTGNFIYDLVNKDFSGKIKDFVILRKDNYSHMIYQPGPNKYIVISKEYHTFWREIASLSFFFILFLVFGLLIISYKWIWVFVTTHKFNFRNLKFRLFINSGKMLYKTRIQIALVMAVVSSLVIVGLITFSYISIQYKEQQDDLIKERIKIIVEAFESRVKYRNTTLNIEEDMMSFTEFSKMYNTDLNLYDVNGILINSTQPRVYNLGIQAKRMDAYALIQLRLLQKAELLQDEHIGNLNYKSAYMPVKNAGNNVIAYLQLPYFSNQNEFNQRIGNFLNLLINIYVLVFVAIGFFAFIVANQITSPLTLIQESMAKTVIGRKNKPIFWRRNDEIGNLITEYNKMILALEESANKLAQSERETAWREMAKQVAHEIKNPLTPLRLGIQMLERSWKEKDPKFDTKFEKFSKSFLEQIDSLSSIASEFSNFAKMPDLKLEVFELVDVLNQAIHIYKQMEGIHIIYEEENFKNLKIKADRDQLLRSFNNLLKNAIEAMPENKAGIINISCQVYTEKVEIKVQDNGTGIAEDLRSKIFTPNFTTKSSGTGLGLAFVKQAVENIGGNIYFTTQINAGTSFFIILPLVNK
ncbi:sensor histidine kinase [Pedobacter puniceum]|uniref:histidine kinase n=1 Tax=Pedobacter puniceum TaxID=2666136 RepID=A0A7K0FNY8_9SPHI|nr:ATP-binding protein [Pedobacter puniceum]MRX47643.1 GHKL domain-containing protein [Pedobacter puniceum]